MNPKPNQELPVGGPAPITRSSRLAAIRQVTAELRACYGDRIRALGIFGSVARETDGPYSDIELFCVVEGKSIDAVFEWSTGPWKCLVGIYSEDVMARDAAVIDETWPFVQSGYVHVKAIEDPDCIFQRLREIVLEPRPSEFREAVKHLIVGEVYEIVGKIRNAKEMGVDSSLPMLAVELAKWGACLTGLANRHLYTSFSTMLEESMRISDRPEGYDALYEMVMSGRLVDPGVIVSRADRLWHGIETWAAENGIRIYDELQALLSDQDDL